MKIKFWNIATGLLFAILIMSIGCSSESNFSETTIIGTTWVAGDSVSNIKITFIDDNRYSIAVYFNGELEDYEVFPYTISGSNITLYYNTNNTNPPSCTGLLSGSTLVVHDFMGSSHDLTFTKQ